MAASSRVLLALALLLVVSPALFLHGAAHRPGHGGGWYRKVNGTLEVQRLVKFLNTSKQGYKSLVKAVISAGAIGSSLANAINNGTRFTLLAPTDKAFAAYKPLLCGPTLTQVLEHHVIPYFVGYFGFVLAPINFKIPTLYGNVTKLSYRFRPKVVLGTAGVNNGTIVYPNTYVSRSIVVQGINAVLIPTVTKLC